MSWMYQTEVKKLLNFSNCMKFNYFLVKKAVKFRNLQIKQNYSNTYTYDSNTN